MPFQALLTAEGKPPITIIGLQKRAVADLLVHGNIGFEYMTTVPQGALVFCVAETSDEFQDFIARSLAKADCEVSIFIREPDPEEAP